jgi:hypothetical protein
MLVLHLLPRSPLLLLLLLPPHLLAAPNRIILNAMK